MTDLDRETFLVNLRASGLLAGPEVSSLAKQLPAKWTGRVIARHLVKEGILSRFQAAHILAGSTTGLVIGQYRVLDRLGQGGMGRVFKAVHVTMERTVALKVLAPELTRTDRAQKLFMREVKTAAQLIHPNIVTAYDANGIGDRLFLVMEYVAGPNLEQLVQSRGSLPVDLACELIRQTACGLQYAHEKGMVHRDIKPPNLLVQLHDDGGCTIKILDFGLAFLHLPAETGVDTVEGRRPIMGTPDFLAPELARKGRDPDIRSDLYSLGCTFWYLLTGQVLFPGGTPTEKVRRHLKEQPTALESLRPDIPEDVVVIIQKLLVKDPAARYQTPAELATALAPFAAAPDQFWNALAGGRSKLPDTGLLPGNTALDLPPGAAENPVEEIPDLDPTPMEEAAGADKVKWSWAGSALRNVWGIFKKP